MSGKRVKQVRKQIRKARDAHFVLMFNALCKQPLRARIGNAMRIVFKRGI